MRGAMTSEEETESAEGSDTKIDVRHRSHTES